MTIHDLLRELHEHGENRRTVGQIRGKVVCKLRASCPLADAIRLMATQHAHRAVVVSDTDTLVGVVSAGDIVRALARAETPHASQAHLTEQDRLVSLGFLANGVAHEASNALTPMRLSLGRLTSFELSRRPLTPEHLHRIELLQDVREGIARIERVIHELKAFANADDAAPRTIDVSTQLEAALAIVAHEIRHRARLVCHTASLPAVRARPADLRQVFPASTSARTPATARDHIGIGAAR